MKNRSIEVYRFIFSLIVCLHHIRGWVIKNSNFSFFCGGGYLAVDLFFMISGYFLMDHYCKNKAKYEYLSAEEAAFHYAKGRWKRLFFHHTYSWIVYSSVAIFIWKSHTPVQVLIDGFFEFFMMEITGFGINYRLNGVGWYCSALVVSSFLSYYLINKNKKLYLFIIIPISYCFIFSFFCNQYGSLNRWTQCSWIVCDGLLRGFVEMGIGCICFYLVQNSSIKLFHVISTQLESILYGIMELSCFCFICFTMIGPGGHKITEGISLDFIVIPVMALFIIIIFSKKSILYRFFDYRIAEYLGKLSFAIYLDHLVIQRSISKYVQNENCYKVLIFYLIVVVLYSIITTTIVDHIEKFVQRKCQI